MPIVLTGKYFFSRRADAMQISDAGLAALKKSLEAISKGVKHL